MHNTRVGRVERLSAEESVMRKVATSWKVVEEVLWEHAHRAYEALRPPAAKGDVTELEDAIGQKLPAGFKASLLIHDGMTDRQDLVDYQSLLSCERIDFWWRLCTDHQRRFSGDGNTETRTRKIRNDQRWRDGWIPVMEDLGGDLMVLDLEPGPTGTKGQIFPWYNNGATAMRVMAESFPAWLDALAEELLYRRFTLSELGTINLRRRLT
jgi:cell wall assembly regulator SMI1